MATFILLTFIINLHIPLILSIEYENGNITAPFTMHKDDGIISYNSLVRLTMQPDGNLVIHSRSSTSKSWAFEFGSWTTSTNPNGDHINFQSDGELVIFTTSGAVQWTSNSITGTAPYKLIVSDDADVYILDSSNTIVWCSNPSFSSLQTIWYETFDSTNEWSGDSDSNNGFDGELSSISSNCPNAPDKCLKVTAKHGTAWGAITTVISMYSAIQLQVDVRGNLTDPNAECVVYWLTDNYGFWERSDTYNQNKLYKDVIIGISLPNSYESIEIALQINGKNASDQCFFDNAILRGALIQSTTQATDASTYIPTDFESTAHTSSKTNSNVSDSDLKNKRTVMIIVWSVIGCLFICVSAAVTSIILYFRKMQMNNSNESVKKDTVGESAVDPNENIECEDVAEMKEEGENDHDLIRVWLTSKVGLAQYFETFIENCYDSLEFISEITDPKQLLEIGITMPGHRTHIMSQIKLLRNDQKQGDSDSENNNADGLWEHQSPTQNEGIEMTSVTNMMTPIHDV